MAISSFLTLLSNPNLNLQRSFTGGDKNQLFCKDQVCVHQNENAGTEKITVANENGRTVLYPKCGLYERKKASEGNQNKAWDLSISNKDCVMTDKDYFIENWIKSKAQGEHEQFELMILGMTAYYLGADNIAKVAEAELRDPLPEENLVKFKQARNERDQAFEQFNK